MSIIQLFSFPFPFLFLFSVYSVYSVYSVVKSVRRFRSSFPWSLFYSGFGIDQERAVADYPVA